MLQRVLNRASHRGFSPYYYDLEILAEKAQYDLFLHSCRKGHCLSHLVGWLRSTVGRTLVFGQRTDPVLRSACSQRVATSG